MRIIYLNPSRIDSGLDFVIKSIPLGLISIAAMVPEHKATLLDYKVDQYTEKAFRSELNRSDVVAISSLTPQIYEAFKMAKIANEEGCTTVIGGYHPTLDPDFVIKKPYVDYIIRGEGEHTFKELIDFIDAGHEMKEIKRITGLSYKDENGIIHHNPDRALEPNLDSFPLPRRDLVDNKKYIYLGNHVDLVESSRGCPYNCKFCCIRKMWKDPYNNRSYRTKGLKRILKEIYSIDLMNDFIFFCEDNFTINVKRTKEILNAIIKSGIPNKLHFSCQSRVDTLFRNPWLMDLLRDAGFRQIFLGIESVHQQSLDAMNKQNTTPVMTRKVVEMLQDRGISIFGGVIIGYPGETKKMVRETINYTKSLKLDVVQFTPITAFPGTEFYDDMKEKEMITSHNYRHYDLFHSMMSTEQLSSKNIYRLVGEAYASYYSIWYLKEMAKRYFNIFGNFSWMLKALPKFIKSVLLEGSKMLSTQGISGELVSDELKEMDSLNGSINPEYRVKMQRMEAPLMEKTM